MKNRCAQGRKEIWSCSAEILQRLTQVRDFQVMLAMEIMDTPFMNSITKHLQYEKRIHSPWYKLYPDIGNLSAWGHDVEKELAKGKGNKIMYFSPTIAASSAASSGVTRL